jgi:hypothetical protein
VGFAKKRVAKLNANRKTDRNQGEVTEIVSVTSETRVRHSFLPREACWSHELPHNQK